MNLDSHHVVPNKEKGGWDIKRSGGARASQNIQIKTDAVAAARKVSQNQETELFVHGKHGKIQSRDSHGKDPYPPKG